MFGPSGSLRSQLYDDDARISGGEAKLISWFWLRSLLSHRIRLVRDEKSITSVVGGEEGKLVCENVEFDDRAAPVAW